MGDTEEKDKNIITAHGSSIAALSIRMAALEEVLISKGVVTNDELNESFEKMSKVFQQRMKEELHNLRQGNLDAK